MGFGLGVALSACGMAPFEDDGGEIPPCCEAWDGCGAESLVCEDDDDVEGGVGRDSVVLCVRVVEDGEGSGDRF